ncbi:MAG TPA: hypothetical protein VES95_10940 [Dermatophilaceae bacterium]|nr:hypothetical protein [Dermatophilaceae bacterium]
MTCGSACLTVARMLLDPVFASWVTTGTPHFPGAPAGDTQAERFAAYERVVMRRTNGVLAAGSRPNLPWPRVLGTPPWGAKLELELGAAKQGTRYVLDLLRPRDRASLVGSYDRLVDVVADGEPALLYVGNATLPRHVVLVLPGDGDRTLDGYDPGSGAVRPLRRDDLVGRRLALSGWDVPWLAVRPSGARTVQAFGFATARSSTSAAARVSPTA